ncbi:CMP-N,N'-diacetyllegionaminic acid synthase [Lachnospiraceae bacterium]|jgi:CMP-N,N'-diacetyllegionaminic acid synthase|uniref:acylneuraminate cytidylyltransferase family protein n=1 Tax=Candidatus Merdisoma sp. JLR.KK011 TaxID=3114299 RepID=UPI00143428DB|nr:CMP-N,N'-diacetyllegionaminic acid synthase [Lachnospiraceae bacterium]
MRNLAVIPARSGSKGLPDKNIKPFCGKPLMAHTIETALKSGIFHNVMVSTDSAVYAGIAKEYGAEVPFLRSRMNSSDKAGSWDTVKEVLSMYEEMGEIFDSVCLLQPTSPLRTKEDILSAYQIFRDKATVAVVSVCETSHTPLWCNILPKEHSLEGFIRPELNVQRQAAQKYYSLNGAIYIVYVKELEKDVNLYRKGSFAYIMEREKSVDIDTELDFLYAELIAENGKKL